MFFLFSREKLLLLLFFSSHMYYSDDEIHIARHININKERCRWQPMYAIVDLTQNSASSTRKEKRTTGFKQYFTLYIFFYFLTTSDVTILLEKMCAIEKRAHK